MIKDGHVEFYVSWTFIASKVTHPYVLLRAFWFDSPSQAARRLAVVHVIIIIITITIIITPFWFDSPGQKVMDNQNVFTMTVRV